MQVRILSGAPIQSVSKIMSNLEQRFLTNTDETGRFIVTSNRTGRKYFVEPVLGANPPKWGDLNPATGKIEGSYGKKYVGAVHKNDSLVTEENGFIKVHNLDPGTSPLAYIDALDAEYPDK